MGYLLLKSAPDFYSSMLVFNYSDSRFHAVGYSFLICPLQNAQKNKRCLKNVEEEVVWVIQASTVSTYRILEMFLAAPQD